MKPYPEVCIKNKCIDFVFDKSFDYKYHYMTISIVV